VQQTGMWFFFFVISSFNLNSNIVRFQKLGEFEATGLFVERPFGRIYLLTNWGVFFCFAALSHAKNIKRFSMLIILYYNEDIQLAQKTLLEKEEDCSAAR
jgi:hypothetical protein